MISFDLLSKILLEVFFSPLCSVFDLVLGFITWYQSHSSLMASNQVLSLSSPSPRSSSSLSSASQADFSAVAMVFSFIPIKLEGSNSRYSKRV